VPQVKKQGMREAIVEAAFHLFSQQGYTATTMAEIAGAANMTVANLYVYFDSKLLILYEIYRPWLGGQLDTLRQSVRRSRSPRSKLKRIFMGIWDDIPKAEPSFANALIEALASAPQNTGKPAELLTAVETFLTEMILESLPPKRQALARNGMLAHVIWMAFDGFVINQRSGDARNISAVADLMTDLLLGETSAR
jgi:AcrR family transcriptional regulator